MCTSYICVLSLFAIKQNLIASLNTRLYALRYTFVAIGCAVSLSYVYYKVVHKTVRTFGTTK